MKSEESVQSGSPARVLHVANSLGLGGTEKVLQLFVTHLDPARYQGFVFSFEDGPRGEQIREKGIPTYIGQDFLEVLRKVNPDLIHLHRAGWPEPKLTRPILLHRLDRPTTAVVETNVFGRLDDNPSGQVVDLHLFVSEFCRLRYCEVHRFNLNDPRLDVLYNPVETNLFSELCSDRKVHPKVIGRLSRPDPGKWSALAWEMFQLVALEIPEVRYEIVGLTDEAREAFQRLGLLDKVVAREPISTDRELAAFFNGIGVLAHANDAGESFGMAIAEAMAAGLPVVTHPALGLRDNGHLELVEHGKTGLITSTAKEYGRAVIWLLNHPEEAAAMGRAGREKAARLYSIQPLVRKLESFYDRLLNPITG